MQKFGFIQFVKAINGLDPRLFSTRGKIVFLYII